MPCHYRILTASNLVAKQYWGVLTANCVLKMLDDIEEDPDYREGVAEFDDLRSVTELKITSSDVARFADLILGLNARKRRPTRKAILAGQGAAAEAAHGFCQLVEDARDFQAAVFDDVSDALAFLRIPEGRVSERTLSSAFYRH